MNRWTRSPGWCTIMSRWWIDTKGADEDSQGSALNIANAKSKVSMRMLLRHYGAELPALYTFGWKAIRCPFHGTDKNPSASFNEKLARFKCHTCDVGGDVVDLVQQIEHCGLKEALHYLAVNF